MATKTTTAKKTTTKKNVAKETPKAPPIDHDDSAAPGEDTADVSPPGERNGVHTPPAPEPPKRGPGRPKGSGKKTTGKSSGVSPSLGKHLQGLHAMVGMITGIREAFISDQEAEALADAIGAVAKEYDLSLSGKTGAAIQLLGAAAMVYVPRFVQYRQRMAKESMGAQAPAGEGGGHEAATH